MKQTIYIVSFFIFLSCAEDKGKTLKQTTAKPDANIIEIDSVITELEKASDAIDEDNALQEMSALESMLIDKGLVDVTDLDSSILVEIKYSTTDNFMKLDMYGDFDKAYLQKDVAEKLSKAQSFLKETNPELSLLIYDAVRPRHIQQQMWDSLKMPFSEKIKFVSNPKNGSLHNFGAAVDVTLAKLDGKALDMGTLYDYIGELAYPTLENKHLASGALKQEQINNRILLRKMMKKAGFFGIQTEWWHFNSLRRSEARKLYKIVE